MKKILITGAAGGLGLTLCQRLAQSKKYIIRGLVAPWDRVDRVEELRKYVSEIIVGDITQEEDVKKVLQGVDVLVNCAAALADKHEKENQFQVNVLANELLLRNAQKYNLEKMIVISTAGVATGLGHGVDDENSPYRKHLHNYHIWSKIENEKNLARVSQEINYACIILRSASIYGPHMTFRWGEIISYIKKGTMKVFDHPDSLYPLIHEQDLARAVELCIEKMPRPKNNDVIIISSDERTSLSSIVNFIAKELHEPPPKRLPYWAVLAASYVIACVPMKLRPKQLQLISPWSVREYRQGHTYVTDKAKKLIGFTAEVPFEEGMREVLKNKGLIPNTHFDDLAKFSSTSRTKKDEELSEHTSESFFERRVENFAKEQNTVFGISPKTKRVLVTGANGHVGSALIPLLINEGWLVSGLVRKTSNISAIKNYPIDLFYGDMADALSVENASRGCEIIFHLAAPTVSYASHEKGVALVGLKNVYEAAIKSSARKIIYISSTVTIGVVDSPEKKLDEESFMHLTGTPYQDAKWEVEQKALEYARNGKLDLVIVNPSTIIGAGDLRPMPPNRLIIDFLNYAGNLQWLRDFQLRGAPVWFNTGLSVVDVNDIARGIYLAGQKGKNGERYILSGDNITMRQLHQELSALTGLPTPFIYVPKKIMYAASWVCNKLMTHPPMSYDLAKTMVGKYAFFSCDKAQKELGYTWTSYQKTLVKAIEWFLQTDFIKEDIKLKFKNVFF